MLKTTALLLAEINTVSLAPSRHYIPWWHQMEIFSALLALCARNPPVPGEFASQRPVTRSFDVFFDLRPNKRLSKQSRGWWFETPLLLLWRHWNVTLGQLSAPMPVKWHWNAWVTFLSSTRKNKQHNVHCVYNLFMYHIWHCVCVPNATYGVIVRGIWGKHTQMPTEPLPWRLWWLVKLSNQLIEAEWSLYASVNQS